MDEVLHHLRKPAMMSPAVNTNKRWFLMVSKWCEMDFVHPQYHGSEIQTEEWVRVEPLRKKKYINGRAAQAGETEGNLR